MDNTRPRHAICASMIFLLVAIPAWGQDLADIASGPGIPSEVLAIKNATQEYSELVGDVMNTWKAIGKDHATFRKALAARKAFQQRPNDPNVAGEYEAAFAESLVVMDQRLTAFLATKFGLSEVFSRYLTVSEAHITALEQEETRQQKAAAEFQAKAAECFDKLKDLKQRYREHIDQGKPLPREAERIVKELAQRRQNAQRNQLIIESHTQVTQGTIDKFRKDLESGSKLFDEFSIAFVAAEGDQDSGRLIAFARQKAHLFREISQHQAQLEGHLKEFGTPHKPADFTAMFKQFQTEIAASVPAATAEVNLDAPKDDLAGVHILQSLDRDDAVQAVKP